MTSDYNPPQTDCPRITGNGFWVEDWIAETWRNETHYSTDNSTGAQVATMEDQTFYKEYYSSAGWQKGLLIRTENYAANESSPRKWTTTQWSQDNTLVNYQMNPRPTETNIFDSDGNHRRSTMEYTPSGLPSDSFEFAADGATILRRTHTDYLSDQEYQNRHILGLPSAQFLYGRDESTGTEQLLSKVDYQYDASGEYLVGHGAPVQHDEVNYGLGLVYGRGNLTRTRRFDVNSPNDESKALAQSVGYNTTGLPYFTRDALGHQVTLRYEDSFSDSLQHNAMAYPTKATDADGFSSLTQYNFDFGAVTRKEGPPPQGFSQGAIETTEYDLAGRVSKVKNEVNGAYTRFEYPTTGKILNTFTTIRSTSEEAYTAKVFDGAGRVRAVAGDLPNSTGHYWGQYIVYDIMGRVGRQSNPTETSATGSNWAATGDDDPQQGGNGWVYTQQTYDWKGRTLVTTNPDATTKEASYGGCGCAGGAVVTLTDEGTIANGVAKKRQQKIYSDVLGRTVKTEVLNWDGAGNFGTGGSVYSTTVNTYNARDQLTLARKFQGSDQSGVYQDTTMSYDGYGRLQTTHLPEQDANTATVWNYNPDDTVSSVTDARGALQTFSYNNRHLVTGVAYSAPSGITPAAPASFAYDAVGNRTSMTDGLGGTTYHYDQLSRLDSETRVFDGFGTYPITYAYNLANELTSITDPFGAQVGYTRDIAGRISAMTGSGFADVTSYASDFQYRASGALKHVKYGNGSLVDATYNTRMQPASFTAQYGISMSYERFADGRLKYSRELRDPRYDRSYSYDQAGQLTQALSGAEARGEAATNDRPYKQDMTFDVWGNMTSRTAKHWSRNLTAFGGTYVNNRMNGWQYDADGRNTVSNSVTSKFDAAGRLVQANGPQRRNNPPLVLTQEFDGDGQRAKKTEYSQTTYLLRSSVMGGALLTEIRGTPNPYFGQKQKTHVYADGSELAEQNPAYGQALYRAIDPSGVEQMGTVAYQLDPLGNDVGDEDPYLAQNYPEFSYPTSGDMADLGGGCASRPGIPINCSAKGSYIRRLLGLVLPQLTRFRPGLGYPGTPPTFPNSQVTLGSIFKDATEGTVLGELLYPKMN